MTAASPMDVRGPSYKRVDYSLRRAKAIQRKMVVEGLSLLRRFAPFSQYRFIGFGGLRFADLALVHQQLGITKLISIEHEADGLQQKRLQFNKPLRSIELRFGKSNDLLPKVPWTGRTIVWLDYDDGMSADVLTDVATFGTLAQSGSALLISLPLRAGDDTKPEKLLKAFRSAIGSSPLPAGLISSDLDGWGWAQACRRVIAGALQDALADRGLALASSERLRCHQVYNIEYVDSRRMLTVGFVIVSQEESGRFLVDEWTDLPWFRSKEEALRIDPPILTPHELRHLAQQLPRADGGSLSSPGISDEELAMFEQLYRHYPLFIEAIA
ncbi:MAG: hypothetical protein JWP08_3008 [Bryobacterales bacterium]|nr:hypothetical protein [Bryobacterales bacterium]